VPGDGEISESDIIDLVMRSFFCTAAADSTFVGAMPFW
jgi:hypothetical protein